MKIKKIGGVILLGVSVTVAGLTLWLEATLFSQASSYERAEQVFKEDFTRRFGQGEKSQKALQQMISSGQVRSLFENHRSVYQRMRIELWSLCGAGLVVGSLLILWGKRKAGPESS